MQRVFNQGAALAAGFCVFLFFAACDTAGESALEDALEAVEQSDKEAGAVDGAEPADAAAAKVDGTPDPGTAPAEEPAAAAKPARRFIEVRGKVTLDGQPAVVDMEVPMESVIKTGPKGYALVTLMPDSIIEVRKKTEVKFGKSLRKDNSLLLLAGALWSFLPKGMASYEVVTRNAVAGVRGTVFYVEANSAKKSYICACDGDIDITQAKGKAAKPLKSLQSSMEHKAFSVISVGKKGKLRAKKKKRTNHTEKEKAEIMQLAAPGG